MIVALTSLGKTKAPAQSSLTLLRRLSDISTAFIACVIGMRAASHIPIGSTHSSNNMFSAFPIVGSKLAVYSIRIEPSFGGAAYTFHSVAVKRVCPGRAQLAGSSLRLALSRAWSVIVVCVFCPMLHSYYTGPASGRRLTLPMVYNINAVQPGTTDTCSIAQEKQQSCLRRNRRKYAPSGSSRSAGSCPVNVATANQRAPRFVAVKQT